MIACPDRRVYPRHKVRLRFRYQVEIEGKANQSFLEAALRTIPTKVKNWEDLGLPQAVRDFAFCKHGLVVVCGPTNSGKTTTLAAMVDAINQKEEAIIICIEDPIEYVHRSNKSIIKQRELGVDTLSYAEALRRSLRQDPDVIMVGEIIDLDCILAALQAAETGHQFKMHTFEKSIDDLFTKGQISGNTLTVYLQDIASKRSETK